MKSDYDYTVDLPAWITGEKVKEGYNLTLAENTTGNARKGNRYVHERKRREKKIVFLQFGINDIAGTYEATYLLSMEIMTSWLKRRRLSSLFRM